MTLLCLNFWVRGQFITVKGTVYTEDGKTLPGATIKDSNSSTSIQTDENGRFNLRPGKAKGTLTVSYVNYESQTVEYSSARDEFIIRLKPSNTNLDEVQIIGYGQTTKRLNTGSVSSIGSEEIGRQPVTNVVSSISGRMAGVLVNTTNGLPGGGISVQIRGKGSITAGSEPLYIIDGVPYPSTSLVTNTALGNGITGAISPINSLNPGDIENITVLKDADATAIYGSRGANGVILITTKKGKSGLSKVNIEVSKGFSNVANRPDLLDLEDYLQIRREAFTSAGKVPSADPSSPNYAPDLTLWNQSESTDWATYTMGNTANYSKVYASVSGGSAGTTFLLSGNYQSETSVLQGKSRYERGGTQLSLNHRSENQKFAANASMVLTRDNNIQPNPIRSLVNQILLPPNFPLYDSQGNLNFYNTGVFNPLAAALTSSEAASQNIIANANLSYEILKGLKLKTNIGFNSLTLKQTILTPKASLSPTDATASNTYFGNNDNQTLIIEPQLDYSFRWKDSRFDLLLGGAWQQSVKRGEIIYATNFNSERMLRNISSASTLVALNTLLEYKYASVFGRITYNLNDRYILNASIRRDGSSRFGPNNQFGTFGALGAAWIITNEKWFQDAAPKVSLLKLRGSLGTTGNDQITDYQYLSSYGSTGSTYQGYATLSPTRIANADFRWEQNRKLEFGLESGFFKNRLLVNINYFRNISNNQLVNYTLPSITGFASYQANLPAKINNTGWEFEISSRNINGKKLSWETTFNITINRNKLVSFPGIENSSYSNSLQVGESILRATGYQLTGIDDKGIPLFLLKNGESSASPSFENSFFTVADRNPSFYGGLGNSLSFKGFSLNIFAQFAKQELQGGLSTTGSLSNNFQLASERWRAAGDEGIIPKPTLNTNAVYKASSANYFDASYIRIKNISLSYQLPKSYLKAIKLDGVRFYFQGQNLFTIWNRRAALFDPETGAGTVPPLRTFNFGLQLTL